MIINMSNMPNKTFEFIPVSYKESINKELKKAIGFGVVAFLITSIGSGKWLLSMPVGLLIFSVFYYKAKRWYRINIEEVEINSEILFKYTEKDKRKSINSTIDKVEVIKRMSISKGRVPYLILKFINSGDKIIQYGIGDWNEKRMDEIRNVINESKV